MAGHLALRRIISIPAPEKAHVIALRSLEVIVESESDARGLVGIAGASTALDGIRMTIKIGADSVPEQQLRELAAWGDAHSAVSCTLRERPPVAVEISVI